MASWHVWRDGKVISPALDDDNACWTWLLKHQGQSVDHALRYEGYSFREDRVTYPTFEDIDELREFVRRRGNSFLSPDNMRYFNGRLWPTIYGGRVIVISEQASRGRCREGHPRLYTVSMVRDNGDGSVDVVNIAGSPKYRSTGGAAKRARAVAQLISEGVDPAEFDGSRK